MITGPDGKIKYVNHSFMISTGYIFEEVVGEKPSILKSGKHTVQFYKKLWDTILAGNIWRGDICNRKKNGDLYWQLQSIFPVKNIEGVITHFIAIKIDDTERLRAEEKLKEYSAELERSNQDLNEFASIASHDLQEPLRKLTIFSDRLQEKYADVLDDTGRGYVERILKAAIRMQNFIDDLLKFSRTKTHPQPFELVNLEEIVSETLMGLEAMIGRTNGQVEIKGLPVIEAEKFHMQQLFQNLITNALKFHKEGEPPVVVINSRREERGLWTITVEDNGIGFDEKYVGKIFKPFQRLHGMNVYAGSGIGLAICKKIVERHGGSISAKSQPQKGATFFITLPEKQPAEGEDVER
ncbi:MAG: PAS domain S-box protein [Nitrospinae bacterium]|nr:PAS domain S-box protein [Nitrospinota bacterium]